MGFKATTTPWDASGHSGHIKWEDVRDRIDIGTIATALLGPAPGRRGEKGRGLWWSCPLHQDKNPSFQVDARKGRWKCFGCSEYGDAPSLVMKLRGMTFPDAVRWLAEQSNVVVPSSQSKNLVHPPKGGGVLGQAKPAPSKAPAEQPTGIRLADALTLVETAAARLWSVSGATALEYLRGRGLEDSGIRAARLGVVPNVAIPKKDGSGTWNATGITIPWFDGDRLTLVKIRQPGDRKPKYGEAFRDRPTIYPAPSMVQPGRPLVICEGEFDALLLGQQIGDLVQVITLGSASNRPAGPILDAMLAAPTWYLALDGDEAGDKSAATWPARARRVRPPAPYKDWGDVHKAGFNLVRYIWGGILPRARTPWEVLETVRWGTTVEHELEATS
jgi:DNA primase